MTNSIEKNIKAQKKWAENHPETVKESSRAKYKKNINKDGAILAIDHDHSNGKIRELLCRSCNLMLGNDKDSISTLFNAIIYLEKDGNRG